MKKMKFLIIAVFLLGLLLSCQDVKTSKDGASIFKVTNIQVNNSIEGLVDYSVAMDTGSIFIVRSFKNSYRIDDTLVLVEQNELIRLRAFYDSYNKERE